MTMNQIMKDVNKDFGEDVFTLGLGSYEYRRIPFTSPRMNFCTYGGIPIGKLTEFYGEQNSGKTTTALDVIANYQNTEDPRKALYVDVENTFDAEWAQKLGVDVSNLYIFQPKGKKAYAEKVLETLLQIVEEKEIGLWVLDSIGALISKQDLENELEDKSYGGVSQALTKFSKRAELQCSQLNCTGIGINQERANLNSPYGGVTTPGGKAWKFHCSLVLRFSKGKFIDEKRNELAKSSAATPAGNLVSMSIEKTKCCSPNRRLGFYTLMYDTGIDYIRDLADMAIYYGIIEKNGGWYTVVNIETGEILQEKIQGQANLFDLLESNDELMINVEEQVNKAMI